ncbi:MAG: DUF4402 domain-containing protein [Sphingomonadaceae bacterium]|nr:DUF4402 domain-containing protein [Sphingomonadaceae bacterium]
MNKIVLRAVSALALVMTAAGTAQAADSNAVADAAVVQPLQLVNTRDLEFGAMLSGATDGTMVVNPSTDARTATGGVTAAGTAGHAAQFFTYGGPLQFVLVTRGPLPVLQRQGGGASMNVSQLVLNGPVFRYLSTAGVLDLRVGGTLQVGANQPSGNYDGDYTITVTYF